MIEDEDHLSPNAVAEDEAPPAVSCMSATMFARRLLAAALALACGSRWATSALEPADTVFRNGSIYTLDSKSTQAQALAVKAGRISWIGPDSGTKDFVGPNTTVVDLQGRMAMPGLIDSHMHVLSGGLFLIRCNLNYQALSFEALLAHIQGCIDAEPEKDAVGAWLEVVNMDYFALRARSGEEMASKSGLDKLRTKRPVIVRNADYHLVLVNSLALKASNISAETADPANGKIERLPGSKEPSGVLLDDAYKMLSGPRPDSPEDLNQAGLAAMRLLREAGITTFQDASASDIHGKLFDAIKKQGALTARGYFDYRIDEPRDAQELEALVRDVVNITSTFHDKSPISAAPTLK